MRHKDDEPKAKKTYEPPQLTIYGTVRELTQMQGTRDLDSHGGAFQKTKT